MDKQIVDLANLLITNLNNYVQENSESKFLVKLLRLAIKSLDLLKTKEYYENILINLFLSLSNTHTFTHNTDTYDNVY